MNTLRTFRDEYVRSLPHGDEIIHKYYDISFQIITAVNRTEKPAEVYSALYEGLILKSMELIHSGKDQEAFENYLEIVNKLGEKYL